MDFPVSTHSDSSVSHLFSKTFDLFLNFDSGDAQDEELFNKVLQAIDETQQKVASGHLFSSNEPIDEIPTAYLQYLFLPYWNGKTCAKCPDQNQRSAFLKKSNTYFTVYLDKCRSLNLLRDEELELADDAVVSDAERRKRKIAKYKRDKECSARIEAI